MNPHIRIDDAIAEIGSAFTGSVTYDPEPGAAERVRGLVLQLRWKTQGQGDTDTRALDEVRVPTLPGGAIDSTWSVPIPLSEPISYHGRLMAIEWELTATLDVKRRIDPNWSMRVVVVPRNGRAYYDGPHPLPPSRF